LSEIVAVEYIVADDWKREKIKREELRREGLRREELKGQNAGA